MVKHFILMSSAYEDGTRIALDITDEAQLNSETITEMIEHVRQSCGKDVSLSTHLIETNSKEWSSVAEYDPFFSDVICEDSIEEFIEKIQKGRTLKGLDVAVYILTKIRCTHLSLEKLVYFAYADYLCAAHKRLFEDDIYAFAHGPVVDSVYKTYRRSGYQYIEPPALGEADKITGKTGEMPAKSRILFAEDGAEKLRAIDRTIQKYGNYSASALVERTHREGTPWAHVDSKKMYQVISDDLIEKYHDVECAD